MITKIIANRARRDMLRLSVISLVVIVLWLISTTYRALNQSQIPPDVKKQLSPLTTSLPLDTIEQIGNRLTTPAIDWSAAGAKNIASYSGTVEKSL
jgi:hypothetical protein